MYCKESITSLNLHCLQVEDTTLNFTPHEASPQDCGKIPPATDENEIPQQEETPNDFTTTFTKVSDSQSNER